MATKPFKKQTTAWRLAGKKVPANTLGAEKITTKSAKWYGTVNGRHVPLCRDKQVAERMLRKMEADAGLADVGLSDQFASHRRRPLSEHLKDFASHLRAKGDTESHIELTIARARALFDGCQWKVYGDTDAARASEWLTSLRQAAPPVTIPTKKTEFTPGEVSDLFGISGAAVRATVKRHGLAATGNGKARRYPRETVTALADRVGRGIGPETVNHYVRAVRGFFRWMVKAKRIGSNPLDALSLMNSQVDVRRARRELTADELRNLFTATRSSHRAFRGLTGEDRYFLYLTAATTGFRANALASLTPIDFNLTSKEATVTLAARFNKSRKPKVQPLSSEVAVELKPYLTGKPTGAPVWGGTWARDHRGAEMIRSDLEAAGIAYAVEGSGGPEYADFHALRHSFLTLGGRSGIDLRTLQELAGHSKPELTARYSHRRLHDLAGAVEKLPNILAANSPESKGTNDAGANPVCTQFAQTPCKSGQRLSSQDSERGVGDSGVQMNEPQEIPGFRQSETPSVSISLKRGRRDSNPQPPDRQSTGLFSDLACKS